MALMRGASGLERACLLLGPRMPSTARFAAPCPVRALLGKFDAAGEAAIDGGIIDQGRDWARQIIQARLEPELAGKHCPNLGWRDGEGWWRGRLAAAQRQWSAKIAVIAGKTGHKFARGAVCRYTARVIWMIRDAAFPAGSEVVGKIEVCRHFSSLIFADFNMVKTQSCLEARRRHPDGWRTLDRNFKKAGMPDAAYSRFYFIWIFKRIFHMMPCDTIVHSHILLAQDENRSILRDHSVAIKDGPHLRNCAQNRHCWQVCS